MHDRTAIVSPEAEGQRELEQAMRSLSQGEGALDEAARRRDYEIAEQHATRAMALLPRSADAHFIHFAAAGRLAQMKGLAIASLQLISLNSELDEVLRLNPNHANALAARGGILVKLPRLLGGDSAKGLAYLERAVELDGGAVGKRLELAEAYHILGDDERARTTARQALDRAEQKQDGRHIELCKRFIAELETSCRGCSLAATGR